MRRVSLMASAVICCAALAGCSDAKKVGPIDDPTTTAAASSPTPSKPTAPSLPADAKGDSADAAVAFTKHYIRLLNYAANTGDVAPLKSASRNCGGCDDYVNLYRRIYSDGGFYRTAGWTAKSLDWSQLEESIGITAVVDAPPATYRSKPNDEVVKTGRNEYTLLFTVLAVDGSWRVVGLRDGSK